MARHSTFRGLFTFLGLYGALLGAFGAHLGLQPSPILSPAVGLKRSVIPLATCAAGRYECPESSGSALILIDCSLSEKGKLQCLYGDTASRTLGGSVGEVVAENGVNAVPTINVCNYDLFSGKLEPAASTAFSTVCRPSAIVRAVYSVPGNAPGDGLPKLEARRVSALDILAKRGGSHNTTTTDSPNNATISDASSNATTFNNHDY